MMKRDATLKLLAEHEAEIAALGVSRLAICGSVARDEATEASDIDILVDIGEAPRWNRFCEVFDFMEEIFPCKVDLGQFNTIKKAVRANIAQDTIYVFGEKFVE